MATAFGQSILRGQYPIRMKGNPRCPSHKENDVVFACQDCKTLICTTCSITSHKAHIDSFLEISKIKTQHTNTLRDFVAEADNVKIPKVTKEITSSRQELSTYQPKYKTLCDRIKNQRDQCKVLLDKITTDYIGICEKMEGAATSLLQTHITNMEDMLDTLVKLSSECKQTLQTGTAVLLHDSVSEIQETDLDIPQTPTIEKPEFTPCQDGQSYLEQAMGIMKTTTDHFQTGSAIGGHHGPVVRPKQSICTETITGAVEYKLRETPNVESKFVYPHDLSSICPTTDGRAWLCSHNTDTLKLVSNKGQVIQNVQHTRGIQNISLDPTTGRLWFCCMSDRTIHEVSASYTPVTRFTTEGHPTSLCVTKESRIVVGIAGENGYNLVVFSLDGKVLQTAAVKGSGPEMVWSITQCTITGNMAVVSSSLDSNDPDINDVISVYTSTLQHLFHYRGEGIQAREAATPVKVNTDRALYDSKGNIVTTDNTRNTIKLISGAGEYIATLYTNKGPIGAVGIQKGDVLWSHVRIGKWGVKLLKYYSD